MMIYSPKLLRLARIEVISAPYGMRCGVTLREWLLLVFRRTKPITIRFWWEKQ